MVCNVYQFWICCRIPEIFAIKFWSGTKLTEILHVFGPNFLGEAPPPEFLEWNYKIQLDSDHVAKFQGDRSMDLGERVAKKKKDNITGKT